MVEFEIMEKQRKDQQDLKTSIYACFQILFIFSLFIMLLYSCNRMEVNKILFTLNNGETLLLFICLFCCFTFQVKQLLLRLDRQFT